MPSFGRAADDGGMRIATKTALSTVGLALLVGCGDDDVTPDPEGTVLGVVTERDELSTLASLVQTAGIEDELNDPAAEITLFAPPNSAFETLPEELLTFLENNPAVLREVLRYHVVLERRPEGELNPIDDEELLTAAGETITVLGTQPRLVRIEDATGAVFELSNEDISAGLSVVHVIDGVMLPRTIDVEPPAGNLVEVATDDGRFSTLLDAASKLTVAGRSVADVLRDPGPLTLFAPTDAAFGDLGLNFSDLENDTDFGDLVTNILLAHVSAADRSSEDLAAAGSVPTEARLAFEFLPASGEMPATIGGAAIADTDVTAANGRIHVLSEVILPPTILEVATSTAGLSTLVDLVTNQASPRIQTALDPDGLDGDRPITVFAPDDTAFSEADLDEEDIDGVLAYHVVTGQLTADDLVATPDGSEIETLDGELLTVRNDGTSVALEDARGNRIELLATDIRAINGVVHVVDTVMLPPAMPRADVVGTLTALSNDPGSPEFGTLLLAAGVEVDNLAIATTLSRPGPFTVFAPTDPAFDALGLDLTDIENDDDLQAVVANLLFTHVVPRSLDASQLASEGTVENLANTTLTFDGTVTPPTIGGAALGQTDIAASNGVLHVLDDVIVPPTILDVATRTSTLSELVAAIGNASAIVQSAVDPDVLSGDRPITVFAPADAAFAMADLSGENLDDVLAYHVVLGQLSAEDLRNVADGTTIVTAQGSLLTLRNQGAIIELVDARGNTIQVLDENIRALNGVVHVLDRVMLPPMDQ